MLEHQFVHIECLLLMLRFVFWIMIKFWEKSQNLTSLVLIYVRGGGTDKAGKIVPQVVSHLVTETVILAFIDLNCHVNVVHRVSFCLIWLHATILKASVRDIHTKKKRKTGLFSSFQGQRRKQDSFFEKVTDIFFCLHHLNNCRMIANRSVPQGINMIKNFPQIFLQIAKFWLSILLAAILPST